MKLCMQRVPKQVLTLRADPQAPWQYKCRVSITQHGSQLTTNPK